MSVEADRELELWRADWQAEAPPAPDAWAALRRRVVRRSRGLALLAVLEVAWTAWLVGWLIRGALRLGTAVDTAFLGAASLLAVGVLAFAWWNRRGVWRPAVESTEAFLELSILRCRRRLRSMRAAWWVLLAEVALLAPWLAYRLLARADGGEAAGPSRWALAYGLLAALTLAVAVACQAVGRYSRRELARLEGLRDDLRRGTS
jgi:hypothetical protein